MEENNGNNIERLKANILRLKSENLDKGNMIDRVSKRFKLLVDEVRLYRYEKGLDKSLMSAPEVTRLISKHKKIKEDLQNYDKDKK